MNSAEEKVHFFNLLTWPMSKYMTPNGFANMYSNYRNAFSMQETTGKIKYVGYFSLNEVIQNFSIETENKSSDEFIPQSFFDKQFLHSCGMLL